MVLAGRYSGLSATLYDMSTFNASPHPFYCSLLEPVLRFFDMRQSASVCFAGVRAFLETAKSICKDCQQNFVGQAINANAIFTNRPILELYDRLISAWRRRGDSVFVMRATRSWLVHNLYQQPVIRGIY